MKLISLILNTVLEIQLKTFRNTIKKVKMEATRWEKCSLNFYLTKYFNPEYMKSLGSIIQRQLSEKWDNDL